MRRTKINLTSVLARSLLNCIAAFCRWWVQTENKFFLIFWSKYPEVKHTKLGLQVSEKLIQNIIYMSPNFSPPSDTTACLCKISTLLSWNKPVSNKTRLLVSTLLNTLIYPFFILTSPSSNMTDFQCSEDRISVSSENYVLWMSLYAADTYLWNFCMGFMLWP